MQPIPKRGLRRDDDLRQIIRATLQRRNVKVTKTLVEDIYTLCIKVAANEQFQELRRIVTDKIERMDIR